MRFGELLSWRWTPTFALVGGSLVFVLLAVLLVPDHLGDGPDATTANGAASGRGLFAKAPGSSSGHARPGLVAPPTGSARVPAREGRTARERRPHVPGNPPPYMDHPVDRLFARNPALPESLPEAAPPPEPPPAAPAATSMVPPAPGTPAPGETAAPALPP